MDSSNNIAEKSVCSEHFLDVMPTQRNPFPKLELEYERIVTHGRLKLHRQETTNTSEF